MKDCIAAGYFDLSKIFSLRVKAPGVKFVRKGRESGLVSGVLLINTEARIFILIRCGA